MLSRLARHSTKFSARTHRNTILNFGAKRTDTEFLHMRRMDAAEKRKRRCDDERDRVTATEEDYLEDPGPRGRNSQWGRKMA